MWQALEKRDGIGLDLALLLGALRTEKYGYV